MTRLERAVAQAVAVCVVATLQAGTTTAQIDTQPTEGLHEATPRVHALTGLRIRVSPSVELEDATIVLRDGLVAAVGTDVAVPAGARVWSLDGRIVYPGFIDAMSEVGLPAGLEPRRPPRPGSPGAGANGPPTSAPTPRSATGFWNPMIVPETDVATMLAIDSEEVERMRSVGVTAALAVPRRGVLRGQSALLLLADADTARTAALVPRVAQHASGELAPASGDGPGGAYPSSLMGAIALLRQALYDAQWYGGMEAYYAANPDVERAAPNSALAALAPVLAGAQPLVYATDDELDYARAFAVADEFGLDLVLYGNGHEYRQAELLAARGDPVIVPLDFPEPPDVDTPDGALDVSLETLEHWELAPSNAAFLDRAGVEFAFTADGIDDVNEALWDHVRLAVRRGLTEERALAALTTVPAGILGVGDRLGTLEPGKIANLVVADADLFTDADASIELVFVDGAPYELDAFRKVDPEGVWEVSWAGGSGRWSIHGEGGRLRLAIDGEEFRGRVEGEQVVLLPEARLLGGGDGLARLSGYVAGQSIEGIAELPDGRTFPWRASYVGEPDASAADGRADADANVDVDVDESEDEVVPALAARPYPAGAFGRNGPPEQPAVLLVRGATLWTSAAQGRLENADLLVRAGRITAVGRNLEAPRGAVIVDAAGKHVTAGLVDAHSHTAISRGINESGSAVSTEVRVADVLDPTDMAIYRQLAGGLTVANAMHGSANPMGGQIQTIKLRWGGDAAGLVFAGAPSGIKFALGENVKQSNWGEQFTTRYPQTRMGVDEIIRDTFNTAARYGQERASRTRRDPPVRRNLRLDAVLEILNRERQVHVHSYRQDEILAFVRLAQEYDIDVAAFQHVLEGYKVAPEIASIGAGGSTFSDWWGFKFEVLDAIPFNGALMRAAGVVTSFNSDDDELATRLNTEAAKAIKYGGLTAEEALEFVTINPAIQLGIDARVGSLEPGKDADFVIWSGPPLSTFSRAEQTWIDGRRYFDLESDAAMRAAAAAERARLIQRAIVARARDERRPGGNGGESPRQPTDVYGSAHHASHAKGERP